MAFAERYVAMPHGDETVARRPTLEQMRRRRLLTATALAKKAGVAVTTVRGIERGATPRFETIRVLSAALDCRPEDIDWPDNPLGLDPDEDTP